MRRRSRTSGRIGLTLLAIALLVIGGSAVAKPSKPKPPKAFAAEFDEPTTAEVSFTVEYNKKRKPVKATDITYAHAPIDCPSTVSEISGSLPDKRIKVVNSEGPGFESHMDGDELFVQVRAYLNEKGTKITYGELVTIPPLEPDCSRIILSFTG